MSDLFVDLVAPNGREIKLPTGLFINNTWVRSSSGQKIKSINPFNEEEICSVEAASAADVDAAVGAARSAFLDSSPWRTMSGTERGALMHKLADLMDARAEDLATLETWDNGKPYAVSLGEDLPEAAACLRYYAGWADKVHGQTIPTTARKFAYTVAQPVGVCAQIVPWNYPLVMASWKLGPALAAGNVVVLKPAEQTPLSALLLALLVAEAGFPPGVVNVVNGLGAEAGAALVAHPGVDKVAFTGSTAVGREVMRSAGGTLKKVTLETGGKSPLLVFPDADLGQAAKWAFVGGMSNQGQVCTATSRLLVHESVAERFLALLLAEVRAAARLGDPFDAGTTQGPQVSRAQRDKILAFVRDAEAQGAVIETGGDSGSSSKRGYFVAPTVLSGVTPAMRAFREEIFGPVVSLTTFASEDEAVRLANDSAYGLAAAVFSRDVERAHGTAARLQAGMVWVNSSNDPDPRVPFGGVKQSGVGRELGEAGLAGYVEIKAVHVNMGSKL